MWWELVDAELARETEQENPWDKIAEALELLHYHDLKRFRDFHRASRGSFPPVRCWQCKMRFAGPKGAKFCSNRCKQKEKYERNREKLQAASRAAYARKKQGAANGKDEEAGQRAREGDGK